MVAGLFHLAVRSFLAVPGSLGSTWLGILFPILATAVGESLGVYKFGWMAMKKNWTMPTLIGLAGLGFAYTLLFVWCGVKTIYDDRISLSKQNYSLGQQLKRRNGPGLSLHIGGFIAAQILHENATEIEVTINARNDGEPTKAHAWGMYFDTSKEKIPARYMPGGLLLKGSLDLPRIETPLQQGVVYKG